MDQKRAGKLPSQIIKELQAEKSQDGDTSNSSDMVSNKLNDKQWVLITIDPERDSPEIIDEYAKGFDSDFIGLSGSRPMLLSLATQLAVNNKMPPMDSKDNNHEHLNDHANNIILLNPQGQFVGFFRPPFDISRLSLTYQSITQLN